MRTLTKLLPVLLLVVLMGESSVRAETRVQVEIVHLTYTSNAQPRLEMHKILAEWAKTVEGSPQPLVSLLDDWLEGQDRAAFTAEAMHITAALGQEVEVLSQQPVAVAQRVPHREEGLPLGQEVKLKTGEAKDGQIGLEIRFMKSSPNWNPIQSTVDGRGHPVPRVDTFMFDTNLMLKPGMPHVLGGLVSRKGTPQGDATSEAIMIIRARRVPVLRSQ